MGSDFPAEIWHLIASYLSPSKIFDLMSVNRAFLNVALDMKYREVRWTKLDKDFLNLLSRLQSPVIAARVRKLFIRAWFIDYLLKREGCLKKKEPLARPLDVLVHFFSQLRVKPQHEKQPAKKSKHMQKKIDNYSSKRIIDAMISAIEGMSSVVELHFEWRDLPLTKDTKIFLDYTRLTFEKTLRSLALQAPISKFKELLAITNFAYLHELNFHFDFPTSTLYGDGDDIADAEIKDLSGTIIPFIAHRRTVLRSLQISSSSPVDLSKFFLALPAMPGLRQMGLDISFHKEQLSNLSGLVDVLTRHSHSLLHVQLKSNISFTSSNKVEMVQKKRNSWERINNRLLAIPYCLSNLESLEIPFVSLEKTIPLIKRSCDTLTRLHLRDHFLTIDEVTQVLNVFTHRSLELHHLHLEVELLQGPLIQLLACRLPDLHTLVLVYNLCHDLDPISPKYLPFKDWKLDDLGIYRGRYRPLTIEALDMTYVNHDEEKVLMDNISKVVHSITRWKGFANPMYREFEG